MKYDTDTITTLLGGAAAAAAAAGPVLNGVKGSMHAQDWTQLVMAVLFAALGYFTNKRTV
jgi:hypothetical protein